MSPIAPYVLAPSLLTYLLDIFVRAHTSGFA